jgi:hypothetical protein
MRAALLALALSATPALAQPSDEAAAFVEGNVLATFYHELGHALIDILELPVLGQEEDAADQLSVVLTHDLWEEDMAQAVAWSAALSFLLSAEDWAGEEPVWWGVHGADLQRHYTLVCLFYGANPEARGDFVTEFELPEERAEGCPEEWQLAYDSWWTYLDGITTETPSTALRFTPDAEDPVSVLIGEEVAALNEMFHLPRAIEVELAACGEANAFYHPGFRTITMCTEYVDWLWQQAEAAGL